MKIRSNTRSAAVALSLTALASWALADGQPQPHQPHKRAQHRAAQAPLTPVLQKTAGSGIAVSYRVDGTPQAGRVTAVVLQFDNVTDPQGGSVQFTVDAGLTLRGSDTLALPSGQRTTATVSVLSEADGLRYLNLFVSQKGATSAISIPIQAGSAAPSMKAAGDIQTTKEGDSIITMPAK